MLTMPLTMDIKEYSEHSGVSVKALRSLIAERKVPATKIANKFMILVAVADEYIAGECMKGVKPIKQSPFTNMDNWFAERKAEIVN